MGLIMSKHSVCDDNEVQGWGSLEIRKKLRRKPGAKWEYFGTE